MGWVSTNELEKDVICTKTITNQKVLQMLVLLLSRFQDSKRKVDLMRVSLQFQKHFPGCRRAINATHS